MYEDEIQKKEKSENILSFLVEEVAENLKRKQTQGPTMSGIYFYLINPQHSTYITTLQNKPPIVT